jgi:hypothetical protein
MPFAMNTFHGRLVLDASTTPSSITDLDPGTVVAIMGNFANGTADTAAVEVSASSDNGATWGGWFALTGDGSSTRYPIDAILNLKNGFIDTTSVNSSDLGGSINAIRFRHSLAMTGAGNYPARIVVYAIGRAP